MTLALSVKRNNNNNKKQGKLKIATTEKQNTKKNLILISCRANKETRNEKKKNQPEKKNMKENESVQNINEQKNQIHFDCVADVRIMCRKGAKHKPFTRLSVNVFEE